MIYLILMIHFIMIFVLLISPNIALMYYYMTEKKIILIIVLLLAKQIANILHIPLNLKI